jgi:asparagine synthase (glutamine-hydrolysing)
MSRGRVSPLPELPLYVSPDLRALRFDQTIHVPPLEERLMCGIAGFLSFTQPREPAEILRRMSDTVAHRGPDAQGQWFDTFHGVGLAHRRLAIVDLSEEGRQPMCSASGRYFIVFNGEVYNFLRIRADLERLGHLFHGHSDTEVMLAAFEEWGLEPSLRRFIGMFAFALWDSARKELTLARDRLGKKPLYYALTNGRLVFGSELKALRAFPGFEPNIDRQALTLLVRHCYIPSPHTIYTGVCKLEPAHVVRFAVRQRSVVEVDRQCFWSAAEFQAAGSTGASVVSASDATGQLDELLRDSVQLRMIADVPLGAFLSGGIDSSLVVALMQALSSRPVRTFTIGFHEDAYNEAQYAKAVARHLGTDHTEVYLTPAETLAVIPKLPLLYDEPFADSSQIPTALVCAIARKHVTVALSGDGGDEGFGGYPRYVQARDTYGRLRRVPVWLLRALSHGIPRVPMSAWEGLGRLLRPIAAVRHRADGLGYRMLRLADRLGCVTPQQLYLHLLSYCIAPSELVVGGGEPRTVLADAPVINNLNQFVDQMMLLDTLTYLPDDILVKVDRASMAVALEVRAPLLDHRVLEFAWRLPLTLKLQGGRGKVVLRTLLSRYVPQELFERPKTGFGVPLHQWLRGPLREWAEELLDERRLVREGYFEARRVSHVWQALVNGQSEWPSGSGLLWNILMFQAWLEHVGHDTTAVRVCDSGARSGLARSRVSASA